MQKIEKIENSEKIEKTEIIGKNPNNPKKIAKNRKKIAKKSEKNVRIGNNRTKHQYLPCSLLERWEDGRRE